MKGLYEKILLSHFPFFQLQRAAGSDIFSKLGLLGLIWVGMCWGCARVLDFNAWNPQKMPEVILDIIDAFRTSEFVWKRPMNLWRPVFSKVNVEFSIKVASVFRYSAVLVAGFQCDVVSNWSLVRSPPTCHQEGIEWWIPVETHHGRDWQVEILGVFGDDLAWGSWLSFLTEVGSW